jgi:hypothetical protein
MAAMGRGWTLVNGPSSAAKDPFGLFLEPVPITPSQIFIVVVVGAAVTTISFWQSSREDADQSVARSLLFVVPFALGAFLLASYSGLSLNNTNLVSFIGSINWLLYFASIYVPMIMGGLVLGIVVYTRARQAVRRGGPGRPVDHFTLEMLDWVEELDKNADCWRNPAKRRHLLHRYSRGAADVESRLKREIYVLYGRKITSGLALEIQPRLVGAHLREHASAVPFLALPRHVEALRLDLERTLWAASVGDWTSFRSTTPRDPKLAWWRRHARNLLLGAALLAVGLWIPQDWLESIGLGTQRSAILIAGATFLVAIDPTASRLRELIPSKGS